MPILSLDQRTQLSEIRYQLQQQDIFLQQIKQKIMTMHGTEINEIQIIMDKMLQENRYQLQLLEGLLR